MEISFQKDAQHKTGGFNKLKDWLVKTFKNFDNNFYFFLFLCLIGVFFFADSLFRNDFTTLFGGDYEAQQLAFYTNGYDDWWTFLKTGKFVWFDTNTYLGASNVGSNSFYYLFDPFFLPILICPREFIAQGMAFLTIFKMATAGMFFTKYMQVMGASKKAARISGTAFAFNGWIAWFLWFNHMTEVCIIFPLMLWGVERILRDKKPWLLMFSTALMGMTNYFFLIGMSIAAFLYAIFRFFQRLKLNSAKDNWAILGIGFIGFLAGILLSGFVSLPSIMNAIQAPRSANSEFTEKFKVALTNKDFGKILSLCFSWQNYDFGGTGSSYRHVFPLINFFFPCASCRGTPLTIFANESYDNVATNIYCFVPMMLFFFPAFVQAMKEKKWSVIVATVLFLLALTTPLCYFMFFGFTAPYGRWEIFFVTSFITFSGLYIDHMDKTKLWEKITSYVLVMVLIIVAGAVAQRLIDTNTNFTQRSPYLSCVGATLLMCGYTTIVFVILLLIKKEENRNSWLTLFVAFEAVVMGFLTIEGHWCNSFVNANNGLSYNNSLYKVNQKVKKDDKNYYRCWSYLENENARNDGMRNDYNGLGCFHSLYNFELNNFLDWTRIQDGSTFTAWGSWAGCYVWKNTDLDKFLGVKYYYIQNNSPQWFWLGEQNWDYYQYNVPLDFVDVSNTYQSDSFAVFKDEKNLNFAFTTDDLLTYISKEKSPEALYDEFYFYYSNEVLRNDEMLLEGAIVDQVDAEEILKNYPNLNSQRVKDVRSDMKKGQIVNLVAETYDLNTSKDKQIYTVNTFFEDYAQRYLGGAHALTCDQLVHIDNGDFERVTTIPYDNTFFGRYVTVLKPGSGTYFEEIYDEKGYAIYVPYDYEDDYAADIYLVSDDGRVITWDRHQDDAYKIGGEKHRGFYVHASLKEEGTNKLVAPKVGKIIIANREKHAPEAYRSSKVYFETYTQQQERYKDLYNGDVFDIKYSTNTFKFKTNINENKFVVTQMPCEKGWTVKAKTQEGKTKNIKVYSVQGGYVGFVAEKGLTEYTLEFYPQYLKEGKLLSLVGAFIFLSTFYGIYFYTEEFKKKEKILDLLSI